MASRRQYSGNAPATVLQTSMTASTPATINVSAGTGTNYPDGSVGPFYVVIDRGTASEEKILMASRSVDTFTISARGADGTNAVSHTSGTAVFEHVMTKTDADEANAHISLTTQDDHTQYLNATRHDTVTRHPIANLPTGTGATQVALGNHTHPSTSLLPFSQPGTLVVATGKARMIFPAAATVVDVRTAVNTAPTGATIIVDVKKNGSTIFTTSGNRPTIAISGNASGAAVPDITAFAAGDYMTVDVAQVGSGTAGTDLTAVVRYTIP